MMKSYQVTIKTSFIVVAESEEKAVEDAINAIGSESDFIQYFVEVREIGKRLDQQTGGD